MGRRFDPRNRISKMQLDGENLPIPEEEIPTIEAIPATPEDTDMMDEEVAAEPMPEEPMPVESETEESVDETESVPALATPVPPASTAALEAAKSPEEDEYETMMKDYARAQKDYGIDYEKLVAQAEEEAQNDRRLAGIAAVVQSFGEGISAITGSSTKPLQTATESIRRMGEMRAAERSEKAKTLKERLMQKRAPIEAKMEETKFRDVFEQRQKAKRLADPASPESKQARELANNFLDAYIASVANRTDETQLARIEGIRPRLENLSANQIKDFVDNLNKLKFTESKAELEGIKASYKQESDQAKAEQQAEKTKGSQEFKVQRDTYNKISKIESVYEENNKFYTEYNNFKTNVDKAIAGDAEARKWVKANKDAFGYIVSRTKENRGVFTDQDADRLDTLFKTEPWAMKFKAWLEGGLQGDIPLDSLKNLQDTLKTMKVDNPLDIRNKDLKRGAKIARASDDPATQKSASYFERLIEREATNTQEPAAPQSPETITIQGKEYKEGDIIETNQGPYEVRRQKDNTLKVQKRPAQ